MADDLVSLLANAADTKANFDFGKLAKSYWAGLDEAYKRRTQDAFQNDPSILDDKGNIDPAKAFQKALRVGGLPGVSNVGPLSDAFYKEQGYENAAKLDRGEYPAAPPLPPSTANPVLRSEPVPGPQSDNMTVDPNTVAAANRPQPLPPPPAQPLVPRPVQTSSFLPPQQQPLPPQAMALQPPQAAQAPQLPPGTFPPPPGTPQGPGTPATLVPPQQTALQAIAQRFPTQPPGPQPQALPFTPPPPQVQPAPVQAQPVQARPQGSLDPESLGGIIPSDILRAGGGTAQGVVDLLTRITKMTLPPDRKAPYAELLKTIQEQLKFTPEQKNARGSGQGSPLDYEITKGNTLELGKQDIDTFNKRNIGIQNAAQMSYDGIQKARLMKQLTVDPNFYSGPLNENVKTYNQFKAIFGQNPSSALPQEAFNKVTTDMLTEQIKAMGQSGVGRVLMAEVNNMKQSIASLGVTPQTNRALAEILQRVYAKNQHIAEIANSVPQTPGRMNRELDTRVQNYLKQTPLFTPQELKTPGLLGAPDTPPGSERWSPQQARAWAASVGLKPGDPIRFNGRIGAVP